MFAVSRFKGLLCKRKNYFVPSPLQYPSRILQNVTKALSSAFFTKTMIKILSFQRFFLSLHLNTAKGIWIIKEVALQFPLPQAVATERCDFRGLNISGTWATDLMAGGFVLLQMLSCLATDAGEASAWLPRVPYHCHQPHRRLKS